MVTDFLYCDDYIIDSLTFDDNGTPTNLYPLKVRRIKLLQDFLADSDNPNFPDALDPSAFTVEGVRKFLNAGGTITRPVQVVVPASVATSMQVQLDLDKSLQNNWEQGKRDQFDYTPLKDEQTFVLWLKGTIDIVNMQGYTRLFDLFFVITSIRPGNDQRLWNKQKAYAIVVLTKILKPTQGLRFLSVHEGDPRKQLLSYCAHVLKSSDAGTIVLQAMAELYSNPIDKHKGLSPNRIFIRL